MGQSQSSATGANVLPLVSGAVNVLQGPPPEKNGALHRWKVAVLADSTSTSQPLDVLGEEGSCSSKWDDNFHSIFLSHSGAQKSFVEQLCLDIKRYDRYPFFDKYRDSLPIGCHFPSFIFDAIDRCRVGVVVLSEEFFSRSKWPMLELVAMVKRQRHDPKFIIMPIFLHINRAECRKKVNHDRWLTERWQGWAKKDNTIDLKEWQEALELFGPINGVSLNDKLDEVKCRGEVVEALIKAVPPLTRWDDSYVQGRLRMCVAIRKEIDGMQLSKSYGVKVLGVYGVGGIGKSTACKVLCNDYSTEFEGRVCHIEFGVGSKLMRLQEMLRILTETDEELIKRLSEDKCMDRLKRGLEKKVFLTIDNVSDVQRVLDDARDLLRMEYPDGSIVIVTARSLPQLGHLNISSEECLEMPELEEDDARSIFLYHSAPGSYLKNAEKANEQLLMECIGRCHFGKGDGKSYHYHPLALKVLGGQFGNDPEEWIKHLKEVDLFNRYQEDDKDHPIFSIFRISFEKLKPEDKFLFMDVAIYTPYQEGNDWYPNTWYPYYGYFAPYVQSYPRLYSNINIFDWLSMVYGTSVRDIKIRLAGLKNKSLLENVGEGSEMIHMHDLWHGFATMKAEGRDFEQRPWVYEKAYHLDGESRLSGGGWESLQRACMVNGNFNFGGMVKEMNLSLCSNLRVLKLWCVEIESRVLDVSSLTQLKSLQVFCIICSQQMLQILGLGCLRNLVYLELNNIETSLHKEIWSLTSLRFLVARKCKFGVPDLIDSAKRQLQTLVLYEVALTELPDLSSFPRLRKLITSECEELTGLTSSKPLTALEHLELYECRSLEALPDLTHLVALSYFRVWDCGEVQLTVHEIEKLEAMCPGLQLLFMRGSIIEFYCWEGMFRMNPYEDVGEEPTHLNTNTCSRILVSSTDKLTARYTGNGAIGAIQANRPVPRLRLLYYFEMTVKDQGKEGSIGIGFTDKYFKSSWMPGWQKNSYGYHGDDGMLYHEQKTGEPYAQGFTTGDTVGAGINYAAQEIFFTQNGNILPSVTFKDVNCLLYPTIGFGSPKEEVEVNFGQRKFVFDLESTFPEDRGCR